MNNDNQKQPMAWLLAEEKQPLKSTVISMGHISHGATQDLYGTAKVSVTDVALTLIARRLQESTESMDNLATSLDESKEALREVTGDE